MTVVNALRECMPIARISWAMVIPRSFVCYSRSSHSGRRKQRVSSDIEEKILGILGERITYGYRMIWTLLRNACTHVNIKTVRRIMRKHSLFLPYARHKDRTRSRDLTKPDNINRLWETDIHYVSTAGDGMTYLMSIKDCFSKRWISCELPRSCTSRDCIKAVEKAYVLRFPDCKSQDLILRTDNGPQHNAKEFRDTMKQMGIEQEYIQKHTPEDNGDIG